jgi:hypothetical protein
MDDMRRWMMTISMACACGPNVATTGDDDTTGDVDDGAPEETFGGPDGDPSLPTTMTSPDPATSHAPDTGEGGDTTEDDEGSVFLPAPDLGSAIECDVWIDDCPVGFKCMPWANDGGSSWNATKCTPLADDPNDIGDPCTVEGSPVSGIDDFDGVCIGLCLGSESEPACAEPCTTCMITADGVANLCRAVCDPLAQDCPGGQACYALMGDPGYACVPVAGDGMAGAPCEYINACAAGMYCADAETVPDCESSVGCCTPFCDALADAPCEDLPGGVECVAYDPDGKVGCIAGAVGVCILPE